MQTPALSTERLLMRTLSVDDARHIFSSWSSDENVSKFMRWSTHQNINDTKEWLLLEEESIAGDNYTWGFVLKATGSLIGSGGIIFNNEKNCYELGYNLMQAQWGKGLATEASRKILEFAKSNLKQKKIYCCHAVENIKSKNVIEKLGFIYTGDGIYHKFDGTKITSKEYYLEL